MICGFSIMLDIVIPGAAKEFDQNVITHVTRKKRAGMWVSRVSSKENIADDPSRCVAPKNPRLEFVFVSGCHREDYEILHRIKAMRVEPFLDKEFYMAKAWEPLSIHNVFKSDLCSR